jgi:hypothetical protein
MSEHELTAENLNVETTDDGRIVAEVSFVGYLREHGYPIDGVSDPVTVERPDSDTAHLVYKIDTLDKPTDHPESDAVADAIKLPCCDCWSYRTDTPDVGDGETLEGVTPSCPHVREAYKVENAKSDDQQQELG